MKNGIMISKKTNKKTQATKVVIYLILTSITSTILLLSNVEGVHIYDLNEFSNSDEIFTFYKKNVLNTYPYQYLVTIQLYQPSNQMFSLYPISTYDINLKI